MMHKCVRPEKKECMPDTTTAVRRSGVNPVAARGCSQHRSYLRLATYGSPPHLAHSSSNSRGRISAPRLRGRPLSSSDSSHISMSSRPATSSTGGFCGCSSIWRAIHCPSKCANHQPLTPPLSRSSWRTNGIRKKRCGRASFFFFDGGGGAAPRALAADCSASGARASDLVCALFWFFIFHAWYTLRRRWNSSRQASSRSTSHDVLIVSRRSAYFHLLRSCFLCSASCFLFPKLYCTPPALALRRLACPVAACALASSDSTCDVLPSAPAWSMASRMASSWSRRSCSSCAASSMAARLRAFSASITLVSLDSFSALMRAFSSSRAASSSSFFCSASIFLRASISASSAFWRSSSSCFLRRSSSICCAILRSRSASSAIFCFSCSFLIDASCLSICAFIAVSSFLTCSAVIDASDCTLAHVFLRSSSTDCTCACIFSLFLGNFSTVLNKSVTCDSSFLRPANPRARGACWRRAMNILTTRCMMIAAVPRARIFDANLSDETHAQAIFFQRCLTSHESTFSTSFTKFSGSDFMIVSNSANFPGRKKTRETPNWKSSSFMPSALNSALANVRGSRAASSGGRTALYMSYRSLNRVRDGYPPCIRSSTETIPAHCSCDRIISAVNTFDFINEFGLTQRTNDARQLLSFSNSTASAFLNLSPSEINVSLPRFGRGSPGRGVKILTRNGSDDASIKNARSAVSASLFFSMKPSTSYPTAPAKWRMMKPSSSRIFEYPAIFDLRGSCRRKWFLYVE
eukprot:m.501213 g.501213  ORF g.501213 m.501213 type:complete len:749 (+) comp21837_c1_seq12:65-2311(+)